MASTYTDGLAVEIIGSGDKAGSWGDVTNNNLKALEEGVSRYAEIAIVGGSATSTLNIPDGETAYTDSSKGRSAVIKWTGSPSSGTHHTVTLEVGSATATQARFTAINGLGSTHTLRITTSTMDVSPGYLEIPNGYSVEIHIDNTTNPAKSQVVNSLVNLSIDKLALGNQEVISNTVDDRVDIVSSALQIGDGSGDATIQADGTGNTNRDLVIRTTDLGSAGVMRFNDVAHGNIEITPGGDGSVVMPKVTISDGTIAGTIIGAAAAAAGTFTTVTTPSLTAAAALGITTVSNNDITITPDGSGKTVMTKVDINGGAIDATPIGANSANTGAFSTLSASGLVTATAGVTLSTSGTLDVGARGIANAGPISGATTINATSTSTLAAINASGNIATSGSTTITAANGLIATAGGLNVTGGVTVNSGATNLTGGGITNAGSIAGATTIAASGNIVSDSGNIQVSDGNLGVGVSAGGAGSGNISADGLITTSGGISTTGSSTIVSAGRITSGGGLTAGGTITGATTVTANTFVGALTGNAATVTTNAALTGDVVTTSGNATAIASGVIINSDIKSDAAIVYSKMEAAGNAPDFNQDTTGNAGSVTNGVYTTSKISALAPTTSSELAGVISNNTGSGSLVFATDSVLVAPRLGTPHSGVMTNVTGTAANLTAGTATLAVSTNGLRTTGDTVVVSGSSQPSDGMVLTATGSAAAQWENPVVGDVTDVLGGTNITVASSGGPQPTVNLDAAINLTTVQTSNYIQAGSGGSDLGGSAYVSAEGGVRSSTFTSRTSNQPIDILPNGTGKLSLEANTATNGNSGIDIVSSNSPVLISGGTSSASAAASLIIFRTFGSDVSDSKFVINSTGSYVVTPTSGNRYLSMCNYGGPAASGFRNDTSGNMEIRSKNLALGATGADGWGRAYHSGMVTGDGAYAEVTGSVADGASVTAAHGLGTIPRISQAFLECTDSGGDLNYAQNDQVSITSYVGDASSGKAISVSFNGANYTVKTGSNGLNLVNKSTGATNVAIDPSKWQFRLKLWK